MKRLILLLTTLICSLVLFSQRTIYSYPDATGLTGEDMVLGTSISDLRTKNFKLSDLSDFTMSDNANIKVIDVSVSVTSPQQLYEAVNLLSPFTVDYDELCIINATIDGVSNTYFMALGKGNYGVGGTLTTSDDFIFIQSQPLDSDVFSSADYGWVGSTSTQLSTILGNIQSGAAQLSGNNTFAGDNTFDESATFNGDLFGSDIYTKNLIMQNTVGTLNYIAFENTANERTFKYDGTIDELYFGTEMIATETNLVAGSNITITPSANAITIAATGTVSTTDANVTATQDYSWVGTTNDPLTTMLTNISGLAAYKNGSNTFSEANVFNESVDVNGDLFFSDAYGVNLTLQKTAADDVLIYFESQSNEGSLKYNGVNDEIYFSSDLIATAGNLVAGDNIAITPSSTSISISSTSSINTDLDVLNAAFYSSIFPVSSGGTYIITSSYDFYDVSTTGAIFTWPTPVSFSNKIITIISTSASNGFTLSSVSGINTTAYPHVRQEVDSGTGDINSTYETSFDLSDTYVELSMQGVDTDGDGFGNRWRVLKCVTVY